MADASTITQEAFDSLKRKLEETEAREKIMKAKMEEILQCPVCLTVPAGREVFQCHNGHITCPACANRTSTCAMCRTDLSHTERIRSLVAEQTIDAMGFPINCRFPNCKYTGTKAEMKVHKQECEHRLRECRWCYERVAFDAHEDHERRCHHNALSRLQEEEHDRQLQLHQQEVEQANNVIRRTRREHDLLAVSTYANLVDEYLAGRYRWGLEAPQNQHQPREVEQVQLGQPQRMHQVQDAVHPEGVEDAQYDDDQEDEIYVADHVHLNWEHESYSSSMHSNSTNLTLESRVSDLGLPTVVHAVQDEFFPNE